MAKKAASEAKTTRFASFSDMFDSVRDLATDSRYSRLSTDKMIRAFGDAWLSNPYVQNTRMKRIRSTPILRPRDDVEELIKNAQNNEQALRETGIALNYSSYPFYKLKTTIASILTYSWYYIPQYIEKTDAELPEFKRERRLVDKFCKKMKPSLHGRTITQSALDEGKVFRYVRYSVDKVHNEVYAADLQELPSDWCKIVGRNSDSYYTVAFDFTYFWQAGTSVDQFDPVFREYFDMLMGVTEETGGITSQRKARVINMAKAGALSEANRNISAEKVNGKYYFWVTLPVRRCFTFGLDFSNPLQASMLMGLYLTGADLSQYEYLQKQLLQVPLYALLTGEVPYHDEKQGKRTDDVKLSPTGYTYYQNLFYQIMAANDTSGVDVYFAPVDNLKLQNLQEVPNAADVVTKAYQDFNTKAGVTGILATTDKPMAALVASTQKIEARYADLIYEQFMNMMNITLEELNLKYSWRFVMFGDVFSKEKQLQTAKEGMTLGILLDTYVYNALLGRTIEDDYAASADMVATGIMDMRVPLRSSYTGGGGWYSGTYTRRRVGRPSADIDDVMSEKTEDTLDQGDGENL